MSDLFSCLKYVVSSISRHNIAQMHGTAGSLLFFPQFLSYLILWFSKLSSAQNQNSWFNAKYLLNYSKLCFL